jgi:Ca2+-binding EF-hand superfamily protein
MKKIIVDLLFPIILFFMVGGCNSNKAKPIDKQPPSSPPSVEELFMQMDTNKDDKLSVEEIEGPLKNDFDKVDTNKDGFITKEELTKAPKPNGQKPLKESK